jgi:hypothetical protein
VFNEKLQTWVQDLLKIDPIVVHAPNSAAANKWRFGSVEFLLARNFRGLRFHSGPPQMRGGTVK